MSEKLHVRKRPAPKKLTREQKRLVWSRTDSNAGEGWRSRADQTTDDLRHMRLLLQEREE